MSIRKHASAVLFFIILLTVTAVADDISGRECKTCGNPISDKRFAAVMEEGSKTRYFDDIGCAVQYLRGKCPAGSSDCDFTVKVFDHDTGQAVHIRAAYFVRSGKIRTPGGSGIVAFSERKRAERFLKTKGLSRRGVLDFEDLK